jgi:hypothetical protein
MFIQIGKRLPISPSPTTFTVRLGRRSDGFPPQAAAGGKKRICKEAQGLRQNLLKSGDFKASRQASTYASFLQVGLLGRANSVGERNLLPNGARTNLDIK